MTISLSIHGHATPCRVLKIHQPLSLGTLDVERLSDGKFFRVSGLDLTRIPPFRSGRNENATC